LAHAAAQTKQQRDLEQGQRDSSDDDVIVRAGSQRPDTAPDTAFDNIRLGVVDKAETIQRSK
jgi:hypothetical protein